LCVCFFAGGHAVRQEAVEVHGPSNVGPSRHRAGRPGSDGSAASRGGADQQRSPRHGQAVRRDPAHSARLCIRLHLSGIGETSIGRRRRQHAIFFDARTPTDRPGSEPVTNGRLASQLIGEADEPTSGSATPPYAADRTSRPEPLLVPEILTTSVPEILATPR
jgi:hypothetical protein